MATAPLKKEPNLPLFEKRGTASVENSSVGVVNLQLDVGNNPVLFHESTSQSPYGASSPTIGEPKKGFPEKLRLC